MKETQREKELRLAREEEEEKQREIERKARIDSREGKLHASGAIYTWALDSFKLIIM